MVVNCRKVRACMEMQPTRPQTRILRLRTRSWGSVGCWYRFWRCRPENVTLRGITVRCAKIGVANKSTPLGEGVNSGLLGLAYPALTSAHPANVTDNATYFYNRLPYDPLLFAMHKAGLMDPCFSPALSHKPQNATSGFGGYLSLGVLPPVSQINEYTGVPVEIDNFVPIAITSNERIHAYWTLKISSLVFGSENSTTI